MVENNRFLNKKKIYTVMFTVEKYLFTTHSSESVSENLLVFGRKDFTITARCSASENLIF